MIVQFKRFAFFKPEFWEGFLEEKEPPAASQCLYSLPSRLDRCIRGYCVNSEITLITMDVSVNAFVLTRITNILAGTFGLRWSCHKLVTHLSEHFINLMLTYG